MVPVPDKPEKLRLDPSTGSLRWKALPSCKGEIIGYQVPGDRRLPVVSLASPGPPLPGALCRQPGGERGRESCDGPQFPASPAECLAVMSMNVFSLTLNIPRAVELPGAVVGAPRPLGVLPASAQPGVGQTGARCAALVDMSAGVASQDFLCLLRACFWFLPQRSL